MFYPITFLERLAESKPEHVQLDYLWRDIEAYYADKELTETPEVTPSIEWVKTTEWYKMGGYKEVRAAAYPPFGEQLDMRYHDMENGTNTLHEAQAAVKQKWPKPE